MSPRNSGMRPTGAAYYHLDPEVPGGLGARTQLAALPEGPCVRKLHYEFSAGAQGDDLATSHPAFIISERIGGLLMQEALSGFALADMEQSVDEQAYELNPTLQLQTFKWLQVTGQAGRDDFGLDGADLVVSERALSVLRQHAQLSLCDVEPWAPRVQ